MEDQPEQMWNCTNCHQAWQRIQMQLQMHLQFQGGIWMHIHMLNIQMRIQMHLPLLTSLMANKMLC